MLGTQKKVKYQIIVFLKDFKGVSKEVAQQEYIKHVKQFLAADVAVQLS